MQNSFKALRAEKLFTADTLLYQLQISVQLKIIHYLKRSIMFPKGNFNKIIPNNYDFFTENTHTKQYAAI